MAEEIVFVVNPIGWERSFQSWTGSPVGTWMEGKTQQLRTVVQLEAPGPGKPPRNRTGINYSTGVLEKSILIQRSRATTGRDLEGHVTALPKYVKFVHDGTARHVILPKKPGGVLRFRGRMGTIIHTTKVNHPGTAANPFMVRALRRVFG